MTGEGTFAPVAGWIDPEGIPFDRWFIERVHGITGIDVFELGNERPESLGEWQP